LVALRGFRIGMSELAGFWVLLLPLWWLCGTGGSRGGVWPGRSTRERPGVRESMMQYDNDENMKQSAGSATYSRADSLLV
jgi:hypothetical protein